MAKNHAAYGLTREELKGLRASFAAFEGRHGGPQGSFAERREADFMSRLCGSVTVAQVMLKFRPLEEIAAISGLSLNVLVAAKELKPSGSEGGLPLYSLATVHKWARTSGEVARENLADSARFTPPVFARLVRWHRRRLRLSQPEAAELLGVSARVLWGWEHEQFHGPNAMMAGVVSRLRAIKPKHSHA